MYHKNIICKIIPILLLTGCTASLHELRTISPDVSSFSGALASEYLAYSESEAEQGRIFSAEHFAAKGLDAAKGKAVELDAVNTNTSSHNVLSASRLALVDILRDDVKVADPQNAARTQLLFDCWNNQESRKSSTEENVPCADGFSQAYNELQLLADELVHGDEVKHALRFATGSVRLNAEAKNIIAEIAEHVAGHPDYALALNANYDVKNKRNKHRRLAQKRLMQKRLIVVRGALIKAGVDPDIIFVAKSNPITASEKTVRLSNDKIAVDSNMVDIIMTSTKNLSMEAQ